VLAVIPKGISLLLRERDDNPDAEAYRIMRTNIEFNRKSPAASTITLVSGGAGEGKSTTLNNLAYTFAKGGYTTLVIDADLRRPSQHRLFGVENNKGLSDYLTTEIDLEEVVHLTKIENLFLMTSGQVPSDAVGVLNSQRMLDLVKEVKGRFDIVFFDSPPILGVSDASVLSSEMDLTIIVVQHRRFPKSMLQRVRQAIDNVGGTILGVVLNNVDVRHDQYYEYYTSYYNYYHKAPAEKASKRNRSAEPKPLVAGKPNSENHGEY
jgi:capsular exopolysaccharide synthesis family protein